jgi:hypothetical protein
MLVNATRLPFSRFLAARSGGLPHKEGTLAPMFDSPTAHPLRVETQYAVVRVHCLCGDSSSATMSGFDEADAACPCGRTWRVKVGVEPAD